MVLDLSSLKLEQGRPLQPRTSSGPVIRLQSGRFVRGPIKWDWLCTAGRLPGRALHVAMELFFEYGVSHQSTVTLSYKRLEEMGVDRFAARRGLRALEEVGLVTVVRRRGCSPVVTLFGLEPRQ
jgi:hypothetical protein